jgi:hypothetical protein
MTSAIALFAFGLVTAALSLRYPIGSLRAPGSGFYPLVLGLMLMGLAAGHGIQLYLARPRPEARPQVPAAGPKPDGSTWRAALFLGAVVLATALLGTIGFLLASFLMMLALLWILGVRRWQVAGPIALASAVGSEVVFVHWLRIPLPSGWIGF